MSTFDFGRPFLVINESDAEIVVKLLDVPNTNIYRFRPRGSRAVQSASPIVGLIALALDVANGAYLVTSEGQREPSPLSVVA